MKDRENWTQRAHDPDALTEAFVRYITEPPTGYTIPKRARDGGRPRHELDMAIGAMD